MYPKLNQDVISHSLLGPTPDGDNVLLGQNIYEQLGGGQNAIYSHDGDRSKTTTLRLILIASMFYTHYVCVNLVLFCFNVVH